MSRPRRIFVYAVAAVAVVVVGWVGLATALYASNGLVTIRVHDRESGVRLYLPLPATLVEGAVATGDHLVEGHGVRAEIDGLEEWMPVVQDILEVFEDAPNAVFVEVVDDREHVRVAKRFGALRVDVLSPDVEVEVSVPIRTVRRVAGRLAP